MSNPVKCYNCKAQMYVEWDVWAQCPKCGAGQTWRHPITPEEAARIEQMFKEKERDMKR